MTQSLKPIAQSYIDREIFAGIAWRVDQSGHSITSGVAGYQDHALGKPLPEDAIYRIYSMTKPIVSILAVMLIGDGVFRLNQPIADFDPEFAHMEVLDGEGHIAPANRLITIEHLLTHQAGLSYDFNRGCSVSPYYRAAQILEDGERALCDMAHAIAQLPLCYHPGQSWRYSIAIDVLAHIIEVATGQKLDTLLQERLFDPLGMRDTGFALSAAQQERLMQIYGQKSLHALPPLKPYPHRLIPADLGKSHPVDDLNFRRGGHGLYASLDDYMRFANFLINGHDPEGRALISPALLEMACAPRVAFGQNAMRINDEPFRGYAWNLLGRVMTDPGIADRPSRLGEIGWSGAAATYFFVDRSTERACCVMTQFLGSQHPLDADMHTAAFA